MNSKSAVITIVVLVVIVALAYFAFGHTKPAMPVAPGAATTTEQSPASTNTTSAAAPTATTGTTNTTKTTTTTTTTAHAPVTITYGPNGFSPKSVTVPVGTKVTWVNQSGGSMWVASGVHPTHTLYDGTSTSQHCASGAPTSSSVFDECAAGASFSFTFGKAGTWPFHNHAHASDFGSVTVTP